LPAAAKFDAFRAEEVRLDDSGALKVSGRPLRGPLLVDTFGSTVQLRGGHVLEQSRAAILWMPVRTAPPRLRLYALGRYADGWLANAGVIYVWPDKPGQAVSGWLTARLTASPLVGPTTLTFQYGPSARMTVRVTPGPPQAVRIPICAAKNAHVLYRSKQVLLSGRRGLSVKSTKPVFTPDPTACTHLPPAPDLAT
jgi:hypothetical protein